MRSVSEMEWGDFSNLQLDAVREVGNIGTGNAATALSQLLGRAVDMGVPEADLIPIYELAGRYGSPETPVCAVLIRAEGDFPCNLIFVIDEGAGQELANLLIAMDISTLDPELQIQMRDSALGEVGNIILGAFLNAISMLTGYVMPASVPAVAHDMLGSVMDIVASIFGVIGDTALLVKTSLQVKDVECEVNGNVIMVPDPGSLETLLQKLGV